MPIIKTYEEEEATGELKAIYEQIKKVRGSIGNNAKLFSSSPELLKQQMDFIKYYITHETLSMPLLAAIRILVSSTQQCKFCIDFNMAMLVNMFDWTVEDVEEMKKDFKKAKLEEKEIALLGFAVIAIKDAKSLGTNDMDALRELGWEDQEILDAVNHAARMLATDIVFNTFKIDDYE
jgi:uncharacterized peroxidase-related enzyme